MIEEIQAKNAGKLDTTWTFIEQGIEIKSKQPLKVLLEEFVFYRSILRTELLENDNELIFKLYLYDKTCYIIIFGKHEFNKISKIKQIIKEHIK